MVRTKKWLTADRMRVGWRRMRRGARVIGIIKRIIWRVGVLCCPFRLLREIRRSMIR